MIDYTAFFANGTVGDGPSVLQAIISRAGSASGIFTPILLIGGLSTGMSVTARGIYYAAGNILHIALEIGLTAKGSAVGEITIEGLPFDADGGIPQALTRVRSTGLAAPGSLEADVMGGSIVLTRDANQAYAALTDQDLTDATTLIISGGYLAQVNS